ncbi:S-adenosyl-L-methionine-dependent methyltransferase [Syncephalis fuscata]|nr:S-adenosyl-L-methionine-dependent methyltransferase [Syncephalis fuscata]
MASPLNQPMLDSTESSTVVLELPPALRLFARQNNIDERNFITDIPDSLQVESRPRAVHRYIRVPIQWQATSVQGMDGFYALPPTTRLAHGSQLYQEGKIFGIDITSAIAVNALSLISGDQVLDLCCAPGAKLCYISDQLSHLESIPVTEEGTHQRWGTVTGVDISPQRMANTRALLRKYLPPGLPNARLFVADGTTFNIHAPIRVGPHWTSSGSHLLREQDELINNGTSTIKPFYAPKTLRSDPQIEHPTLLYTKVLVDAECTHDGSIAHVRKHEQQGWVDLEKAFLSADRVAHIDELQRSLLEQGWGLLAPDGVLVYSTCSLSVQQNEAVIAWFLNEGAGANGQAILEPAINPTDIPSVPAREVSGLLHINLRLFIARLRKSANA